MNAHQIKTTLTENGKLSLQNLPFKQGDEVEIIIVKQNSSKIPPNSQPLQGSVLHYDNPFESAISPEDWDANN
ncbi:MAG: hypothetical protein ACRC80_24370 [Waterburya sp.]